MVVGPLRPDPNHSRWDLKGTVFSTFLASANEVMMKVIHYIMKYSVSIKS
jgi:hypothetical protein